MGQDTDDRKRPHLRLVVNNAEKRTARPVDGEELFVPLEELVAQRDVVRPAFYEELEGWQAKAYSAAERFLVAKGWSYGLDPHHGRLVVIPIAAVIPETEEHGGSAQDELLLYATEDISGMGLCLSLETILPYWSDDASVMEEALLYAPILPYGTLFLEENKKDGYLDLIYRVSFPLYPPVPTGKILEKFFAVAALELRETLRGLAEYPE